MQVVSLYGAGDFVVAIPGEHAQLALLSLIRVYGLVRADYARTWDWGLFTFMDYGLDRSNPVWVHMRTVLPSDIYSFRPDQAYYEARLGHRG